MSDRQKVIYTLAKDFYSKNREELVKVGKELKDQMEISHFVQMFSNVSCIMLGLEVYKNDKNQPDSTEATDTSASSR